ncbi:hypothetical protein ONJ17_27825, partial [Salmonella enterica subsp. enterica serovar Agona]|nr:hypothetical protein [Salmonella enterica subsp. enterica serovar Agona]
ERWCLPEGNTPTTHIFKLPLGLVGNMQADMSTSVENEWLCSLCGAGSLIRKIDNQLIDFTPYILKSLESMEIGVN